MFMCLSAFIGLIARAEQNPGRTIHLKNILTTKHLHLNLTWFNIHRERYRLSQVTFLSTDCNVLVIMCIFDRNAVLHCIWTVITTVSVNERKVLLERKTMTERFVRLNVVFICPVPAG